MAQTGYTPIQLYYSTTASAVPTNTNLANGELAINITDGKLYYKDNTGTVKLLTSTGSEISPITNNGVVYINGSGQATSGSALTFDGTSLAVGGVPTVQGELNVFKTGAAPTLYVQSDTSNSTTQGIIRIGGGSGRSASIQGFRESSSNLHALRFYSYNSADLLSYEIGSGGTSTWYVGGTRTMDLTSTGLGIGTSSPLAKLNVVTTGGKSTIAIGDTALSTYSQLLMYGGSGKYNWSLGAQYNVNNAFEITPSTTAGGTTFSTPAFVINTASNVGIGTSSPTQKLTLLNAAGTYGTTYQPIMQIGNTSSGGTLTATGLGAIVWSTDGLGTPVASIEGVRESPGSGAASSLYFRTGSSGGGTTRAILSSNGNFTITTAGKTSISANDTTAYAAGVGASVDLGGNYRGAGDYQTFVRVAAEKANGTDADYGYNMAFYTTTNGGSSMGNRVVTLLSTGAVAFGTSNTNYGTSGQVLTSQGSGSPPIWAAGGGGGGSPGGSNTQVQYNSSGSFAGSANFTFNGTGITTGFFAPSSASAPATGISLSAADTLGFSSASQGNAMFFKTFQIGSSGAYVNQLSIGNGINTSYYSNLYVYAVTSTAAQAKSTDGPGQLYSGNNNIPYRANQVIEAATSGFSSAQYCPVGLESVSRSSGGWQPTQFPTGSFQTFTNIGVYGEAQGSSGYPLGAGFYAFAGSYYANATGFYARTYNIAPTSGSSFCYRSDIGPHVFGGNMVGYHSRVVSGQGSNSNYQQTIGWWHSDETANGVGGIAARFEKAGTVVGTITLTTSATSYNTSSDPRLKDISGPVTSDEAKAFVMGLQPKQGTWKADGSRFCGFLSTDYELIDPSGVSGVAGATEVVGNLIDKDGQVINEDVVEPTPDALPEGGRWERTRVRDIYQTLEYGSAAWCANMTAHAQYLQNTIEQLLNRISALESK